MNVQRTTSVEVLSKVYAIMIIDLKDGSRRVSVLLTSKEAAEADVKQYNSYNNGNHYSVDGPFKLWNN